jgi:site-specific DNA-methyltransferase (adenine-specific)
MQILQELESLIPPLSNEEFKQLERNILEEGIREPLIIWNGILIDGHNRYRIAQEHDMNYETLEKEFDNINRVKEWMINNQFGRRNLSNYQRSVLALQLEDVFREKAKENLKLAAEKTNTPLPILANPIEIKSIDTRKEISKVANVSHGTLDKVKVIQANATPEVKARLNTGTMSINEAYKEIKKEEKIEETRKEKKEIIKQVEAIEISNVFNGDSINFIDKIDFKVKCVITDPPYGMNYISNRRTASEKDKGISNDENLDLAIETVNKVFSKLYNKMEENSALFCFIGWKQEKYFIELIEDIGFEVKNVLIWNKNNHGTGDLIYSFAPKHERIIYATKGKVKLNYRHPDVLEGSDIRTSHPTSKPIDLLKKLIESTTMQNDIIVDPFAGHGSTGIAAKELNRNYWLCELDYENYCMIKNNINE